MGRLFTCALVCLLVIGCGQSPGDESASTPATLQRTTPPAPPHVAWLSKQLPDTTIAYLRIPNPIEMLVRPRGDVLSVAQDSPAHRQMIDAIAAGLSAQLQAALPGISALPRHVMLEQRVPVLEVAALNPSDGSAVPDAILGLTLPARSMEEFAAWLDQLADDLEAVQLMTPVDDEGMATLMAGPMPIYLKFDASSGRLLGLSGFGATLDRLRQYSVGIDTPLKALPELEVRIDASGRGLALWVQPEKVWPLVQVTMDPADADLVELSGLPRATSLWLGTAAREGRSEWRLDLSMPEVGFRRYLTRVDINSDLVTAGEPRFAARLALPAASELDQIIDLTLAETIDGSTVRDRLAEARSEFRENLGFEFNDLLDAIGPDLVVIADDAGLWSALRIRDRAALIRVMDGLAATTRSQWTAKMVDGQSIHHWALPGLFSLAADDDEIAADPALAYLQRLRNHLFWVEQGDYLISASTPQVLMDRAASDQPLKLERWLSEGMDLDWSGTVAGAVSAEPFLPRNLYHFYISGLLMAADLVEVDIDPRSLPSAGALDMPSIGRYGARIDSTPEHLSLALSFEYLPLDGLATGNAMTTVAVMGVLAAIAIPAYSDYTVRAKVAEAVSASAVAKLMISEFVLSEGRFPESLEEGDVVVNSPYLSGLRMDGDALILTFANIGEGIDGTELRLQADVDPTEGLVHWRCSAQGSTVDARHLSASCREQLQNY